MNKSIAQLGLDKIGDPVRQFFNLGPIDLKTLGPIDLEYRRLGRYHSMPGFYSTGRVYPRYSFYGPYRWRGRLNEFFGPYGLCDKHVPDLVRLLRTTTLVEKDWLSQESWALKHAWRAIWHLNDGCAIKELIVLLKAAEQLCDSCSSDDPATVANAASQELPDILFTFGPNTLPAIEEAVNADNCNWRFSAQMAILLQRMAESHPATRENCIRILTGMLRLDPATPELSYVYAAWSHLARDRL